ncbi:NADH ubiquinone oxidoreductase subunit NDUFA12 [Gracilaria domingensis]|nr:NADH ubiquinone oxidoreductase subunit NDUFA12 [Gracilaria domingensis]
MWRSRLTRALDWLKSRRLVGEDEHHLFYSEFIEKGKPERRYVEYKDSNILDSSDRMAVEWWAWLHNRRDTIPSIEEIQESELRKHVLAQRVAVIEMEDEKQRLRQFSGAPRTRSTSEAEAKRRKKVMMRLSKAASPAATDYDPGIVPVSNEEYMNESRTERNTAEEPQGAGEDFQPGSWTPTPLRRKAS